MFDDFVVIEKPEGLGKYNPKYNTAEKLNVERPAPSNVKAAMEQMSSMNDDNAAAATDTAPATNTVVPIKNDPGSLLDARVHLLQLDPAVY